MPEFYTQIRSNRFTLMLALVAVFTLLLCNPCNSSDLENRRETAVVRAVRKVSPVVVNISAESVVRKRVHPFSGLGMDPYFESFFRDFFEPGFEQRYKRTSLGSGVIIDGKRGFILTNAHVIEKMGTITVVLKDNREFKAQIVGADPDSDLAVLRISSKDPLPAIEMGNSEDLMIGETVFAIGNPFGFSNTVTTGADGTGEKEGVLISELQRQSYLAAIGVRPGDIIRQIDEITVKNSKDFEKAIVKYRQKKSVVILLQREDQLYYITVKL
jgi:S1-C subfamily serine protease